MQKSFFLTLLLVLVFVANGQHIKEPVKVTDMFRIKTIGNVTINKQGTMAAFTVTSIEPDGDNKWEHKYVTQIWTTGLDGSAKPRQLTARDNSNQPSFSPDGKQIAFTRAVDGKSQVFLIDLDGGEAQQLTKFKYGAGNPKWSPDGKQILFSASVPLKDLLKDTALNPSKGFPKWSFEKPGFDDNAQFKSSNVKPDPDGNIEEARAYLENNATDRKARIVNKLNFQDETDVNPDMSFIHFFITGISPDSKPRVINKGFYRFNFADFTPDGKRIVLSGSIDSLQHPDRALDASIFFINPDGTGLQEVVGQKNRNYSNPQISPSGKWMAYQHGIPAHVSVPTLSIMTIGGNSASTIDIPLDRSKSNIAWSPDEKYLYFTSSSNGGNPLYRFEMSSKKLEKLSDFDSGVSSFAVNNNRIVYVKNEIANPYELYITDGANKSARKITSFNDWVQHKQLSYPEKKTFVNEKGLAVEYWVMKPVNYEPGKKYPLLLEIHGGPAAMWGPGETSMWHEYQYFTGKGYGVVYSNPRGSSGYGTEFLRANINDWGKGPASDVLTSLDKTIAEGWADTSKLLITGGSYAGYLVTWIIAHDHRFKAACAQRGVYDLSTFFGEGNAWRLVPSYFGGFPWDEATRVTIERESPINYVQNIKTPLIIFHGENDRRTGVIQSEMMFRSLKAMGKPVEYVRHPNATHEITRSGNNRQRVDQMLRTWEFFERWIR